MNVCSCGHYEAQHVGTDLGCMVGDCFCDVFLSCADVIEFGGGSDSSVRVRCAALVTAGTGAAATERCDVTDLDGFPCDAKTCNLHPDGR